jgi:hypothetical protein
MSESGSEQSKADKKRFVPIHDSPVLYVITNALQNHR